MSNNELRIITESKSTISEDIRTLRTNLEFSSFDKDIKTIMITSTNPSEGKSFISSNLAASFALNDKKVLIIDCDLRLGRLHKLYNVSNKNGLTEIIANYKNIRNNVKYIKPTNVKNLDIITCGIVPPNPAELLSSKIFEDILLELKSKYDLLILDCPPVNGLSDSLIITKNIDKTVLVAKYGSTNIDDLEKSKKSLENVGANIAGIVINSVPKKNKKYDYYYEGK